MKRPLKQEMKRLNVKKHDGVFYTEECYYFKLDQFNYTIPEGFAWNGSSCSFTTGTNLEASMIHDYLLRYWRNLGRAIIDKTYYNYCVLNGMAKARAWYLYRAIRAYSCITGGK